MSFLQGLHGAVALALLCSLLFAEEAGVPLPFAPGELVVLTGGLLIATGALDAWLFVLLAIVACITGSLVGYSWARLAGERGLTALARRLHQERAVGRVGDRVRAAGWLGIFVSRLIPGLRIYTTLVAGAVRVRRRDYLVGMSLSTVVWVVAFTALGAAIGIPVEHFLNRVEGVAVEAVVVVVIGVGTYVAVRRTPPVSGAGLVRMPRGVRAAVAAVIDLAVVGSIVTGLLAIGRRVFGLYLGAGWLDAVIALAVVVTLYVVAARRSAGATVGEALLQTSYVSGRGLLHRPSEAWRAARALLSGSDDELSRAAEMLRALGDPGRLRVVRHIVDGPRTVEQLAHALDTEELEVRHRLERLVSARVVLAEGEEPVLTYRVRPELVAGLLDLVGATDDGRAPVVVAHTGSVPR